GAHIEDCRTADLTLIDADGERDHHGPALRHQEVMLYQRNGNVDGRRTCAAYDGVDCRVQRLGVHLLLLRGPLVVALRVDGPYRNHHEHAETDGQDPTNLHDASLFSIP